MNKFKLIILAKIISILFTNVTIAENYEGAFGYSESREPGSGIISFKPNRFKEGMDWLKGNGYNPKISSVLGMKAIVIDLRAGDESKDIKLLRALPFVSKVQQEPVEAGPDASEIRFDKKIFDNSEDYDLVYNKLLDFIKATYPKSNFTQADLSRYKRGLSYKLSVMQPAALLAGNKYKGYWLKTSVLIVFTKQASDNGIIKNYAQVDSPDGWLAKWPSTTEPPPDGHFDHLSPEGTGKYKDFSVMVDFTYPFASKLASAWNGVVERP